MTITADARSSAPTAAGPPTSSQSTTDASQAASVSPYGIVPDASTAPDGASPDEPPRGDGQGRRSDDAGPPHAPGFTAQGPRRPRRRLAPAPVRARVVAGVIDLAIGSLLVTGMTVLIWQVAGQPVLTSGLIAFAVVVGLRWLAIAATGWSLGGLLLRVRMLGARNQTPSPLGSFLHADLILAVSVTTLGLGTIALMRSAASDPEGRGWHDKLSGMALLHTGKTNRPGRDDAPHSAQASAAPAGASAQPSPDLDSEAAPRSRRRRDQKAEKKTEKALRRASRAGSASSTADAGAAAGAAGATVGAQSATEAGIMASPGGTAHPTTSDPVSSSIRRPRPARPGQPARHAGRPLAAGSPSSASRTAPATAAAYTSAVFGSTVSADGYGVIQAPRTAKATKAATLSSSATSAASANPAVSDTDAAAVAAASATPVDPQASAALAAAEASARSAPPAVQPAQAEQSAGTAGSADAAATAATSPKPTVKRSSTSGRATPSRPSEARRPVPVRSSPMDAETATLEAVDDTPEPSTNASPSAPHPADHQSPGARTPSAESSKKPNDSEARQASSSQDATPSTQVPRSKATKAVTSQTMEPRHAHAQRWRTQSGNPGRKTSSSSAAPTEDRREPASQPGVPRRESLFTSERHRFAAGSSSAPEVAHTFDTSSILPSGDRNTQALIDSVPWSSVPTSVDAATVDSLPEGVIISDDGSPRKPSPVSSQPDLTNPATVPGGVPASTTGDAHPTVRSHRSHAQTPGHAGGATSTATPEAPSRRTRSTHRFQGPGIPEPAEGRAAHGDLHGDLHGDVRSDLQGESHSGTRSDARTGLSEVPASRHESRESDGPVPAQPRTSRVASPSSVTSAHTGHSAGSAASAAAPASAPAAPATPVVPAASAQTATPSLPSASSAAPALSVRLVPLLGGSPILIHEPTVVGRDPDNISAYPGAERVALDDPTRSVSKTHAAIFPLLDGVWVTDLHSTNGTRVEYRDGRTVEAVPDKALSALEGSTIFFGRIAFKVEVV